MPKTLTQKADIIFIVGPTACGKTRLAIRLARKINGEIISCDSMQVYKGLARLSQAPTPSDKKKVRHHLIGFREPSREYSVASFRKEASRLVKKIMARRKTPIFAGGSGLYAKVLIDGLFPSPKADLTFRAKMARIAKRRGNIELHKMLVKTDPNSAANIHPNDIRRIIRALEIQHTTGSTMTELKARTKGLKDKYCISIYGIVHPREEIYDRINKRVEDMFKMGVVNEVRRSANKRLSKTAGLMLGLREIRSHLDGEADLIETKELIKVNTRRFAKRQLTWFRADKRIVWLDGSKMSEGEMVKRIARSS